MKIFPLVFLISTIYAEPQFNVKITSDYEKIMLDVQTKEECPDIRPLILFSCEIREFADKKIGEIALRVMSNDHVFCPQVLGKRRGSFTIEKKKKYLMGIYNLKINGCRYGKLFVSDDETFFESEVTDR